MRISFIGGGNMAAAIIGSLVGQAVTASAIHVVDLNADTLENLHKNHGVSTAAEIDKQITSCDVIVLAVKPDHVKNVVFDLVPHLRNQLIISIAAGVRISEISRWSNSYKSIVRAMPNTPALIGMGMTGLFATPDVSQAQRKSAEAVMQAVGHTVWVDTEEKIDIVTAVSGSGPAYVFFFIEAMQQAASELGLSPADATLLSIATFSGASELAMRSEESALMLRTRVTSKGGTTHAALSTMEASGIKPLIVEAITAAAHRSKEIGDEWASIG